MPDFVPADEDSDSEDSSDGDEEDEEEKYETFMDIETEAESSPGDHRKGKGSRPSSEGRGLVEGKGISPDAMDVSEDEQRVSHPFCLPMFVISWVVVGAQGTSSSSASSTPTPPCPAQSLRVRLAVSGVSDRLACFFCGPCVSLRSCRVLLFFAHRVLALS